MATAHVSTGLMCSSFPMSPASTVSLMDKVRVMDRICIWAVRGASPVGRPSLAHLCQSQGQVLLGSWKEWKNVHYFAFIGTSNSLWTWTPGFSPQNFLCSLNHPGIKGKDIVSMLYYPAFLPISYTLSIPWIHLLLSRSTSMTWIQDFLLRIFLNGLTHYSFVEI